MLIFPIIGVVLTNLFGINIGYSYYSNRTNLVQEYNEILFTIVFFNALNWSLYGIVSKNVLKVSDEIKFKVYRLIICMVSSC